MDSSVLYYPSFFYLDFSFPLGSTSCDAAIIEENICALAYEICLYVNPVQLFSRILIFMA